jgi:hypothetical protein
MAEKVKIIVLKHEPFEGKHVVVLGEDTKVLGKSIFGFRNKMASDYMKRLGQNAWSSLSKVYIVEDADGNKFAVNKKEI